MDANSNYKPVELLMTQVETLQQKIQNIMMNDVSGYREMTNFGHLIPGKCLQD